MFRNGWTWAAIAGLGLIAFYVWKVKKAPPATAETAVGFTQ